MSKFTPSRFQQAIFDWIETGEGNAVIEAVAGSGKTTTAVQAMRLIPRDKRVLFLAFNKAIAEELQARVPNHCDARTLNSLGHRAWMAFAGRVRLEADKTRAIMQNAMSEQELKACGPQVRRLVALAKSIGLAPAGVEDVAGLAPDEDEVWAALIEHHDIELGPMAPERVIAHARRILALSVEERATIDFDDQIYMPVIYGISPPTYDWVFVDEAQDLSPTQHRLVEMARRKKSGRIVAIGDSRQAIYGFRGAASDSMAKFRERLAATVLPLSICYRCPAAHVALAKGIVPQIEAAPDAPQGEIREMGLVWRGTDFRNDDLIICRASAPLVRVAYTLLAQRIAVRIMGRDIGTGLVSLVKRLRPADLQHLLERLAAWHGREVEKILRKDPEASTEKVDDKYETLLTFIDMFPGHTPEALCREIEQIYSDRTKGILTLATVHKAKGLEAQRVYVLNRWMLGRTAGRGGKAIKPWQAEQEKNLEYVAYTRAQAVLGFIDVEKRGSGRGERRRDAAMPAEQADAATNYFPEET